jgi:hypothetical protein
MKRRGLRWPCSVLCKRACNTASPLGQWHLPALKASCTCDYGLSVTMLVMQFLRGNVQRTRSMGSTAVQPPRFAADHCNEAACYLAAGPPSGYWRGPDHLCAPHARHLPGTARAAPDAWRTRAGCGLRCARRACSKCMCDVLLLFRVPGTLPDLSCVLDVGSGA